MVWGGSTALCRCDADGSQKENVVQRARRQDAASLCPPCSGTECADLLRFRGLVPDSSRGDQFPAGVGRFHSACDPAGESSVREGIPFPGGRPAVWKTVEIKLLWYF